MFSTLKMKESRKFLWGLPDGSTARPKILNKLSERQIN
jgi:hypothetical protein